MLARKQGTALIRIDTDVGTLKFSIVLYERKRVFLVAWLVGCSLTD